MEIIYAIAAGIVGGIIGVIPFAMARKRIKRKLKKDGMGSIITGMATTFISFAIMVVEMVLCYVFFAEFLLPFAISAIAVFLIGMGIYTARLMRR